MGSPTYQRIKQGGALPSPSGVALQLVRLADDEKTTIDEITATVESDPAIASRLLKLVNSPLAGVPRTIASISTAVKLLGMNTVKNLALGFSLLENHRAGNCEAFDYEMFWSESLARAVTARGLANRLKNFAPDEAFTVALLSRIGRFALASAFPEPYDRVLRLVAAGDPTRLRRMECEVFKISQNDLSAEMMADWRLADHLCQAVRQQDSIENATGDAGSPANQLAKMLHLSELVAAVLVEPNVYRDNLAFLLNKANSLGVGPDVLTEVLDSVREEWREVGTIFSIRTQPEPPFGEALPRSSQEHRTILIVDHDPTALTSLKEHLTEAGYGVLTAPNGVEALRVLHSEGCQIVITDWMMPEMDGPQLCRAIRESEGAGFVYIVMLTAHTGKDSAAEALGAGADDYLSKPYDRKELIARLKAGTRILKLEAILGTRQRELHKTNAQLAILNNKLRQMAKTDELTGLSNRREALQRLEEHWAASLRRGHPLACMLLDIDHFKRCNDTHGHDVGDAVLRQTARILAQFSRAGESVFRLGGEEFVILCPGATAEMAAVAAERVRAAVESNRIEQGDVNLAITVSVGVAQRDSQTSRSADLLKLADQALYQAKLSGRNRVCVANGGQPSKLKHP